MKNYLFIILTCIKRWVYKDDAGFVKKNIEDGAQINQKKNTVKAMYIIIINTNTVNQQKDVVDAKMKKIS